MLFNSIVSDLEKGTIHIRKVKWLTRDPRPFLAMDEAIKDQQHSTVMKAILDVRQRELGEFESQREKLQRLMILCQRLKGT